MCTVKTITKLQVIVLYSLIELKNIQVSHNMFIMSAIEFSKL